MCGPDNPLCEYKSIRFIKVRNRPLVIIYYSLLLGVLLYIVLYTVVTAKGYQQFDNPVGTSSAKVKGTGSTGTGSWQNLTVFDAMDVVDPSTEQDALFITTSQIITNNQTRGICEGNSDTGSCTSDSDCQENQYNTDSQGILTGVCSNGFCQVKSWCPLEQDSDPQTIHNIGNFTVFVKVDIRFAAFDIKRTNTYDKAGTGAPIYGYNLFTVDQILQRSDDSINNYTQIAQRGAIVLATSMWNCNFDKPRKRCNPNWRFQRIDGTKDSISSGYNFRDVDYDVDGDARRLRKLLGVRIIFATDGVGGQFSFAALSVTIGAGLAYLSIASIIADIILEKFLPESEKYDVLKNQMISDGDDIFMSIKKKIEKHGTTQNTPQDGEKTKTSDDQQKTHLLSTSEPNKYDNNTSEYI